MQAPAAGAMAKKTALVVFVVSRVLFLTRGGVYG